VNAFAGCRPADGIYLCSSELLLITIPIKKQRIALLNKYASMLNTLYAEAMFPDPIDLLIG